MELTVPALKLPEATPDNIILAAFRAHNITAEYLSMQSGRAVTRYTFKAAPGTKVSRLRGLEDDLGAALGAEGVVVNSPVKGVPGGVAVDVPRPEQRVLSFSDLPLSDLTGALPFYLGEDMQGNLVPFDLAKAPHLLVAGTTGAGKSAFVNQMLCTLACCCAPDALAFVLIDLKHGVELAQYASLPNLSFPIQKDANGALEALEALRQHMEARYALFDQLGVRTLDEYHKAGYADSVGPLPRIVCVVDEYADLRAGESGKAAEDTLRRIAQKSRATGIHIVLATQSPDHKVITTTLRANFPTKVALRTATGTDSRIILGQNGAEKLAGNGDMLVLGPAFRGAMRVQSPFIDADEIHHATKG